MKTLSENTAVMTSPVMAYENALNASPVAEPIVETPPPRAGKHCRFIVAALLFIAINAGLSFGTPFDFDPYKFVYKGWAWWTMQALKSDTELHNVALLGSSLVVSAVSNCDANHYLTSFRPDQVPQGRLFGLLVAQETEGRIQHLQSFSTGTNAFRCIPYIEGYGECFPASRGSDIWNRSSRFYRQHFIQPC